MNHKENYTKVKNTLAVIETKGNNTLIMADCLRYLEQCIQECDQVDLEKGKFEEATEQATE